ncbi:MAG: hypothetical protein IK097_04820, partial [Clostridia bacterium]|nr:hypothetical protein [Clostridia bacterium]
VAARIKERCAERDELVEKLETEKRKEFILSVEEIRAFLYKLKNGKDDNYLYRRGLINIFVKEIYLYDDRMTIFFHGSDKPIVVTDILLENAEEFFAGSECSYKKEVVSPNAHNSNIFQT